MTAEEWGTTTHLARMLKQVRRRASDRQLRLFACAWSRHYWAALTDPRSRRAVEVAERYADGLVGGGERQDAVNQASRVPGALATHKITANGSRMARITVLDLHVYAGLRSFAVVAGSSECCVLAPLVRCIFGDPFRPPFSVSPAVLGHNDGTAVKLAWILYEDRDPSTGLLDPVRLAILADALEEAGVDDAAALAHLRGPGPHCRGCHVVDAVLGRG